MNKNWEKFLLAALLALTGAGVAALAFLFPAPEDILGFNPADESAGKNVKILTAEAAAAQSDEWENPPVWSVPASGNQLFIAREFLYYPATKELKQNDGNLEYDGIPLKWLQKYRISLTDDVALADQDNDGFSNRIEYQSNTNPLDPASHPPYVVLLRLKEYEKKPFKIRFNGMNEVVGKQIFQLKLLDRGNQSAFGAIGDVPEVGGKGKLTGYQLKEYRPKTAQKNIGGQMVDYNASELDLYREDVGETITLVFNQDIDSDDSIADFIMLCPGHTDAPIKISRGQDFVLPQEPQVTYRLLRVELDDKGGAKQAVIRQTGSTQTINVPMVKDDDYNQVAKAADGATPAPDASSSTPK